MARKDHPSGDRDTPAHRLTDRSAPQQIAVDDVIGARLAGQRGHEENAVRQREAAECARRRGDAPADMAVGGIEREDRWLLRDLPPTPALPPVLPLLEAT